MMEIWVEFVWFKITNQRLTDQIMTIIKKSWFSDLEILEMHQQIYREIYQHVFNTVTETLNTEKPETPEQTQTLRNSIWKTTHPNTTKQALTQEDIMKRIMSEKKTTLPSLRNQNWKTVKAETKKKKWLINKYPNEQHHRIKRSNLCRREIILWKIGVSPKNTNSNSNPDGILDWKHG